MNGIGGDDIHFDIRGKTGLVTIDRPQALNALTFEQIRKLRQKLEDWRTDERVGNVVICSTSEKAFSVGGDVLNLYKAGMAGELGVLDFFRDEYSLNACIKHYPKPYVALIGGMVMGGGVGVSIHGSHRVGGGRIQFAMPEVGIGFFPDVGATYFLSRMPNHVGMYCALTGGRLNQADSLWSGVITHAIVADQLEDFEDLQKELAGTSNPDQILAKYSIDPGVSELAERSNLIEEVFGCDSVSSIKSALAKVGSADRDWAEETLAAIEAKSPTSLEIAFEQLKRGADLNFDECMALEFRIVARILQRRDFYEGVRALLIDKDDKPDWDRLGDKNMAEEVAKYFQTPQDGDLTLF